MKVNPTFILIMADSKTIYNFSGFEKLYAEICSLVLPLKMRLEKSGQNLTSEYLFILITFDLDYKYPKKYFF